VKTCACADSPDEKLRNGHTQKCTDRFSTYLENLLGSEEKS
jgi:hypothetical protein